MKRINGRVLAFVCLALLAVTAIAVFGNKQNVQAEKKQNPVEPRVEPLEQFVSGRVLVKFHDDVIPAHARNIIAALGARDADEIPNIGVHILELPDRASEKAFVSAFQARAEVEFAELDRIMAPVLIPSDPWYPNNWHLPKIAAPSAWDVTTGNSSIVVAILDTGVESTHEDLIDNMVAGRNIYSGNTDTSDVSGHGTNVAGVAGARGNNAKGVAGVCWTCKLMPIRVTDTNGYATWSNMASGLTWAADHGARVANMSFEGVSDSSTIKSGAQYFQGKGGVCIGAAGNSSVFNSSPDNPYVLTISASDQNDLLWAYSNYGNNVDLAGPSGGYTTARGNAFVYMSGTSMASPVVAGVAALVLSVNPALTGQQVQDILKKSADDLGVSGWDIYYGWGRVNAARAVCAAMGVSCSSPTPTPTPEPTPSPSPSPMPSSTPVPTPTVDTAAPTVTITTPSGGTTISGNVSVYSSTSDNVGVVRNDLYVDGVLTASSTTAPFTMKWNTRKAKSGSHTLQCKAYDAAGNAGLSQLVPVYK